MPLPIPPLPEDNTGICLIIPNSPEYRRIFMGALMLLQQWWYWDVDNPEDAEDVIARLAQCHYLTSNPEYGDCNLFTCEDIIDCINNSDALQQLIASLGAGYSVPLDQPFSDDILNKDLITDNTACDNDKLFGATTGIIDLINNLASDLIEILQDNVNTVARVAELIEVIPGIGEVVPADIVTLAENFMEDIQNAYDAAFTVALRDEMRCDLFCLAQDDCNIQFSEILDYYESKLGFTAIDDFNDFFGQYITGTFVGTQLVYAWYYFVIGTFSFGSEVLGIDESQFIRMISALFNDPDPDWSILCDCEESWTETFDFTVQDYATYFTAMNPSYPPVFTFGIGMVSGRDSNGCRDGYRTQAFSQATTITRVQSTYSCVQTATNSRTNGWTVNAVGGAIIDSDTSAQQVTGTYNTDTGVQSYQNVSYIQFPQGSRQGNASEAVLISVQIDGVGFNPFA